MSKVKGFTLIEILIALTVFAILAAITSNILYQSFTTRERINEQSAQLSTLQMSMSFMQQDLGQIIERAIRVDDMRLLPIFSGQRGYLEFTRDGHINPGALEQRSTLIRVAYVCQEGKLLRRTWGTLDTAQRKKYEDRVLVDSLQDCHFGFLNQTLQLFTEWRADAADNHQNKEQIPKAVQINLTFATAGTLNFLFPLPEAFNALPTT